MSTEYAVLYESARKELLDEYARVSGCKTIPGDIEFVAVLAADQAIHRSFEWKKLDGYHRLYFDNELFEGES